jgi:eukaryotic-like serine/threonine-protein kinase
VPHVAHVAETMADVHRRRVVHRDLKPANILIGRHGETVVIDWGTARWQDDPFEAITDEVGAGAAGLTLTGALLGTPAYMPPEQARGEDTDERADVWALGATLHHVLTGQPPFHGTSLAETVALLAEDTRPAPIEALEPRVPAGLAAIVARALSPRREDRQASAAELAATLRARAAARP